MSLITYIEPTNIGSIFAGLGVLLGSLFFVFLFYKLVRPIIKWVEGLYRHDLKYWIVEEKMLDLVANEKGINLDEELLKREVIEKPKQNFRKRIENEVFLKMFPEEIKSSKEKKKE